MYKYTLQASLFAGYILQGKVFKIEILNPHGYHEDSKNNVYKGFLSDWNRVGALKCVAASAAAAKSLQLCPTLCDPIDGSPPGSPIPGILQARTLEWVAISFSSAWKWKVKVKSLSCFQLLRPHELQPTRLLRPWDFPGKNTGVGCHCLLKNM